ncbi:hypothetical protein C2E21_5562 [Chlorella sorokiniana]|uniref:Uncharacterized protein n=1 Tax=Chlorella sorokiniana TaxID=3076 RepID=A0A2P6TNL1_CHLSO|nr:hypothetical protein C2E21_5562 [Chlorella sorokiniana]|eukprot:PRW50915.1 hypothetical protein C2E21_5562 [Chlorella sorokiniana]
MHRFELYRGYLAALLERDSQAGVVLAASQDLLVQSDPWRHPLVQRLLDEDALLFTLEGGKAVGDVPLEALPQTQQVVEACFGAAAAEGMADVAVSCAGLTIGGVGAALKYVSQLLQAAKAAASPKCRLAGSDQAVHNYLLHGLGPAGNQSFAWHMRRNWESPVHAMAYGWPVVVDTEGVLSRVEGEAPPVVYQYERAAGTAEVYRAMYPAQPARSGGLRWDGPECVEGAQLDGVKPCLPPKDNKASSSKHAPAAVGTAATASAAPAGKSSQQKAQTKPPAADASAAAVKTGADGRDRRRMRN